MRQYRDDVHTGFAEEFVHSHVAGESGGDHNNNNVDYVSMLQWGMSLNKIDTVSTLSTNGKQHQNASRLRTTDSETASHDSDQPSADPAARDSILGTRLK